MAEESKQVYSIGLTKDKVVKIVGELDYTVTPKLRATLVNHIEKSEGPLQIDLSGLKYMDSSGLAVFIEIRRLCKEKEREVQLLNVTDEVKKIFALTQVDQLFGL